MAARNPTQIAKRIELLLQHNIDNGNSLGINDLIYGDQDRIAQDRTVCIESGDTTSPLAGVPSMVQRQHECFILCYYARYDNEELRKYDAEQFANGIEDYLNQNLTLALPDGSDPIVTHGWVVSNSPGYTYKQNSLIKASRLTWNGISKTRLGA